MLSRNTASASLLDGLLPTFCMALLSLLLVARHLRLGGTAFEGGHLRA